MIQEIHVPRKKRQNVCHWYILFEVRSNNRENGWEINESEWVHTKTDSRTSAVCFFLAQRHCHRSWFFGFFPPKCLSMLNWVSNMNMNWYSFVSKRNDRKCYSICLCWLFCMIQCVFFLFSNGIRFASKFIALLLWEKINIQQH